MKFLAIYRYLPVFVAGLLFCLLGARLCATAAPELTSAQAGSLRHIPEFALPDVLHPGRMLTQHTLDGQVVLLNIWASWCDACAQEHAMLMHIQRVSHLPIYGIAYHDTPTAVKQQLVQTGNPYRMLGIDQNGEVAIDFGIYGTPESFLIGPHGQILYHHIGVLTQTVWEQQISPLVRQYQSSS